MKTICLVCFWVNIVLTLFFVAVQAEISLVAFSLVCAGLCLASYLQTQ